MKSTTAHEDQYAPEPTPAEEEAWREMEKRQSDGKTRVVPEYQTGGALTWEDAGTPAVVRPITQYRKAQCADWYDGYPDHSDGGGPYETRTLYAAHVAAQAQPKPRPYNASGSLSEYGVFPECDAQPAISGYTCTVPDDCETLHWRGQILSMNELASVAQPAVGEEIHVHIEGKDVLTLPLASSGMEDPRFVVHVPEQQPVSGADVQLLKDARHRIANLSRASVPFDDPLDGPVLRRLDAAISAHPQPCGNAGELHASFEAWRKREYPWTSPATDGMGIAWDAYRAGAALAAQASGQYSAADVTEAHTKGYEMGLRQVSGQDREDAERYRWLRNSAGFLALPYVDHGAGPEFPSGSELDAAIDAARAAAKEQP